MPTKKREGDEEVIRKALPGFEAVKKPKRESGQFLPPNSTTPSVKDLHRKYQSDSLEDSVLEGCEPRSSPSTTQPIVVEQTDKDDSTTKRLTVLVKNGKIRAVQG